MSSIKLEITVGTHFYQVKPNDNQQYRDIIYRFVRRFVKVEVQGKTKTVTTFAAANNDRTWFRFHINTFREFDKFLFINNVKKDDVVIHYLPEPVVPPCEIKAKAQWVAHDYQEPIIQYLSDPVGKFDDATGRWVDGGPRSRLVGIQTGRGKGQPLSARIKVPGGWTTMGELKVGDTITAADGTPTSVAAIYPQGKKDVYRVTFADGRSTLVDDTHLWKVYYVNTQPHKRWRVVDTLEVKRLISMPNPRVYIPLCQSEQIADSDLPIDPYVLGALLGNGSFTGGSCSSITFCTIDEDVLERFSRSLPKGVMVSKTFTRTRDKLLTVAVRYDRCESAYHPVRAYFEECGLWGRNAYDKFIPDAYLHGSSAQRAALLQGLMDTDGTITKVGSSSYSTSSKRLAECVQYLARSLGCHASIKSRIPTYTHNGVKKEGARTYDVDIRSPKPTTLFSCKRKSERTNDNNQYSPDLKLRVKSVELVGQEETQCISINHPDKLYVTDDFIVTHNTFCALKAISELGYKFVIIVLAQFVEKWVNDVAATLEIEKKEVLVVKGGEAMQALTQMALTEGSMDPFKGVVISNRTFQNYLRTYELVGNDMEAMGYFVNPDDLWVKLGIGIRLIDEVHMHFHSNYRLDLYTHVMRSISLSATLRANDEMLTKMYKVAYPPFERYHEGPIDRYIDSYGILYEVPDEWKYKTTYPGNKNYNHTAYEASILKNKAFTKAYGDMLVHYLRQGYRTNYKPGNKFAVYAASIDMCTQLTKQLQTAFPDLTIKRYVTGDPYQENYHDPDGRVTTIGSGGTGHDVKGLTDVHMTNAVDSIQANIQTMGRLRKILDQDTRFYFYSNSGVPKQMGYHGKKRQLMNERAKSYTPMNYGMLSGQNYYRSV